MNDERSVQVNPEGPQTPTIIDRMITSESDLRLYIDDLRTRKVTAVSFDMEGDQGSIRYQYSISIFQCYDGEQSAIIDVLRMGNNPTLKEFLTCQDITKVMFSCSNDIFMTQNVLGCTISPVRDIAIGQTLLGLPVNLSNYLNIDKKIKDSFQRANWLARPIRPELLEYAINDVLGLLSIEKEIAVELYEKNLFQNYEKGAVAISSRDFTVNQHKQYLAKFPAYARLNPQKKQLAASVWIFRELLGESLNCPVGYLISKKVMSHIINNSADDVLKALISELNRGRRAERRIAPSVIVSLFNKAINSPHLPPRVEWRKTARQRDNATTPKNSFLS